MRSGSILLAVVLLAACDGSSRRPGGPGGGAFTPSPRRDAAVADSSESVEDAGTTPQDSDGGVPDLGFIFPDAEEPRDGPPPNFDAQPPPPDTGMRLDAGVPDFGFTFPDAAFDGGSGGPDGGPPAQTQVTGVPGGSTITVGTTDVDVTLTLQFQNAGPGDETLTVTNASATAIVITQSFLLTPAIHRANVGASQRVFTKVPGSGNPATLDTSILSLACLLGMAIPVGVDVTFSNGATAFIADAAVVCGP